jgi:hypothetical protein
MRFLAGQKAEAKRPAGSLAAGRRARPHPQRLQADPLISKDGDDAEGGRDVPGRRHFQLVGESKQ